MPRRPSNPTAAVAYIRVSTDDQHLGPEAQRAAIELWAARRDLQVVSWHEDRDLGGAKGVEQRPGLAAALAALRSTGARYLVAAKRDRFARDVELAGFLDSRVRRMGALLTTADGTSDQETTEGLLMRRMVDVFSEHERRVIRDRTRAGLAVKRRRGERISREAPFGFRFEGVEIVGGRPTGGRVVEDAEEQATLAEIRRLAAAGTSARKIVTALESQGRRPRGKRWHVTTVQRLVRRPAARSGHAPDGVCPKK